ncbi:MAG: ABC transporter permease subunit [Acidobacteriota bacterium]
MMDVQERRSRWLGAALTAPLLLFFLLILAYPVGRLALLAAPNGMHVDAAMLRSLRNSLVLSLAVALVSIVVCIIPAWALARWNFRLKLLVRSALTVPIMFSGVVVGFLAILTIGRVGLVPRFLEMLTGKPLLSGAAYGATGLVLAYLYFEIPRATLALESAFREMNIDYEAAAATLGLGPVGRMRRVIAPLARRAIISTFLLTFSVSLGSYGVALMLSRRLTLLPVDIYTAFTGFLDDERAATMSLMLLLFALIGAACSRFLEGTAE